MFAQFDEVGVLGEAGGIENHRLSVAVGHLPDHFQVGQRNRLSAGGVAGDRNDDEGNPVSILVKGPFEFFGVDIAFERVVQGGVECLVDGAIYGFCPPEFNMSFCGIEMRIARNDITFLYQH